MSAPGGNPPRQRTAKQRQGAYIEVMERTAELYRHAEKVAPDLGLSADDLIAEGRRFWLRARFRGVRTRGQLREFIRSGVCPDGSGHGADEPFALPPFTPLTPRSRLSMAALGPVRVSLRQVLQHAPAESAARPGDQLPDAELEE